MNPPNTRNPKKPAQPAQEKMPRAQVLWMTPQSSFATRRRLPGDVPGAFIPTRTKAEAARVVKANRAGATDDEDLITNIAMLVDFCAWERVTKHPSSDEAQCEWNAVKDTARKILALTRPAPRTT